MKIKINEQQRLLYQLMKEETDEYEHLRDLLQYAKSSAGMGGQRKTVIDLLFALRDSSLINMFQAVPFLCNGRKWVEAKLVTMHKDPDDYRELLKKVDRSRDAIIQICMRNYDNEQHVDDIDDDIIKYVSRNLTKVALDICQVWMRTYARQKELHHERNKENITCSKCGHSWEINPKDEDRYVCHNCWHDNEENQDEE